MKRLITLLCLLISLPALAQFKDLQKAELPHTNLLENPGFERSVSKWTNSGSSTLASSSTTPFEGTKSGVWDASAASETLTSNPVSVPAGWKNKACLASFQYDWQGTSGHILFKVQDGGAADLIEAVTIEPTPAAGEWYQASATFPCPDGGTFAIKLESTANATAIKLDKFWLGQDYRVGQTSENTNTPEISYTAPGVPTGTNLTVGNMRYRHLGKNLVVSGTITFTGAASGSIRWTITDLLPAGFTLRSSGLTAVITRDARGVWAFTDVSALSTANEFSGVTAIDTNSFYVNFLTADLDEVDATAPVTIASGDILTFSVDIPVNEGNTSDQSVTLETQGWKIDANIGGAIIVMGTSSQSTYTEINNSGSLDLVRNTSKGSAPVGIACATTEESAPGALTCSSGNESVGIVFEPPYSGVYKACATFANQIVGDAGDELSNYWQIIQTANNDATSHLQLGGERLGVQLESSGTSHSVFMPVKVCGTFSLSPAKTTLRLMRETLTVNTPNLNRIPADRGAAAGQRDIHWSVIPLTQSFPQAVAISSVPSNSECDITGNICSGEYTATITNVANIASSAVTGGQWLRVGNQVSVQVRISSVDPTAAAQTITEFNINLPIASDLVNVWDAGGNVNLVPSSGNPGTGYKCEADPITDDLRCVGNANDAGNSSGNLVFQYVVK